MSNSDIVEVLTNFIKSNIIHIPADATADELIAWYEILKNIK